MALHLTTYQGDGSKANPFRPVGWDGLDQPSSVDLRPDCTVVDGLCLVCSTDPVPGTLVTLADLPDETISVARRNQLANRLGMTFSSNKVSDIIGEFMTHPPTGKWNPIKPGFRRWQVWCGQLWFDVPEVAGGTALATDSFNRANESPLASPWASTGDSTFDLVSNKVDSVNDASDRGAFYNSGVWPGDHYSKGVITLSAVAFTNHDGVCMLVRADGSRNYYRFEFNSNGSNNVGIGKKVASAYTGLVLRTATFASGNTGYGEAQGSTLQAKINGVNAGASTTDTSHTSGKPGIGYSAEGTGGGTSQIDDWEAGDFTATREQEGYRWRNDDGSEAAATWLASQDTDISRAASLNTRLRVLTNITGNAPSEGLKLQYRRADSNDEWKDVN